MDLEQFDRAIGRPGGGLKNITRIEIEIVGRRSLRWTLFEGSKRLCSLPAKREEIRPVLISTRAILRALTGLDPSAPDEHETTTARKEITSNGR